MNHLNVALGLALMSVTAAAACAAPEIPSQQNEGATASRPAASNGTNAGDDDGVTNGDAAAAPAPGSKGDGGASTPPKSTPTPGSCAASVDYAACVTCCDAPTGGALAAAEAAFGQCSCGAGGACASACGTSFCNGQKGNAACEACLTSTCDNDPGTQCTPPACATAEQCIKTDCGSKQ